MKYITEKDKIYFRGLKKYINIIVAVFLFATIFSAIYESHLQKDNIPQASNNYSNEAIKKEILIVYNSAYNKSNESIYFDKLKPTEQWFYMFSMNSFIVFVQGSAGVFFGVLTLYSTANQGIFMGKMLYLMSFGYGFLPTISGLLPHAILEIPAMFFGLAIGLRLGDKHLWIYKFLLSNSKAYRSFKSITAFINMEMKEEMVNGAIFYIKYIIPMLFVAGFIEEFISGRIRNILFGI